MAHVDPIKPDEKPELAPTFAAAEAAMGFLPNSLLTMARKPDILRSFTALTASTLGEGRVPTALKSMVAEVASTAAGCRYCQAHGGAIMSRAGIEAQKATTPTQLNAREWRWVLEHRLPLTSADQRKCKPTRRPWLV